MGRARRALGARSRGTHASVYLAGLRIPDEDVRELVRLVNEPTRSVLESAGWGPHIVHYACVRVRGKTVAPTGVLALPLALVRRRGGANPAAGAPPDPHLRRFDILRRKDDVRHFFLSRVLVPHDHVNERDEDARERHRDDDREPAENDPD